MKKYIFFVLITISLSVNAEVKVALLKDAEARFKQTRTTMVVTEPIVQTGTFVYMAPDSICWKYDGMEKVQLPKQMLTFIRQAVSGDFNSTKDAFDTRWDEQKLTLTPLKKQIKKFFSKIDILFNSAGVATTICLEEPNGDLTKIEFIKMKYNIL